VLWFVSVDGVGIVDAVVEVDDDVDGAIRRRFASP
jgi:hypothetical protein